jgi:signal transduction histidine kinase
VHIEITDRGPGIHPDDLSRIFTKFGRGRDALGHRLPGVGLGLYLSRRIVQAHGGALVVVSEPDTGTTFSFDLEEVS